MVVRMSMNMLIVTMTRVVVMVMERSLRYTVPLLIFGPINLGTRNDVLSQLGASEELASPTPPAMSCCASFSLRRSKILAEIFGTALQHSMSWSYLSLNPDYVSSIRQPLNSTTSIQTSVCGTLFRASSMPADAAQAGDRNGAAAPIVKLSRLALKDALLELEIVARKTRDASSAAVLQLFQSAEKRLGVEVDIPDPAQRNLFQIHVLAVEELLSQVRSQAMATLEVPDS
eukprot:s525_g11.t1